MFEIKDSSQLYEENIHLLLEEDSVGELLLQKKRLQNEIKLIDEAIKNKIGKITTLMGEYGLKSTSLDDEYELVYVSESSQSRTIPKKDLVKYIVEVAQIPQEDVEEAIFKESKVKAHLRIVPRTEE